MLNIEKQVELAWGGTEVEVVWENGEVWEVGRCRRQAGRGRGRGRGSERVGWAKAGSNGAWRMEPRGGVGV
jgi:hypothetical protein